MAHTTEHHVEEVEHALHGHDHGSSDNFNARVAMTMAIIAAMLACVTMLSHRAHNETLNLQTQAGILHTQATDQWGFFQAKNIRDHQYRALTGMLAVVPKDPSAQAAHAKLLGDWKDQTDKYAVDLPKMEAKARELVAKAEALQKESEHSHHKGDRFDLAELAVEMGLILCSIAVLTKKTPFWFGGIIFGVAGIGTGVSAFLMH